MPKRKRPIPTPAWERHHSAIGRTIAGRSPQFYATAGIILLVLAAIGVVGYGFVSDYIAKKHRPDATALKVDQTEYTLKYYAARLKQYVQQAGGASNQNAQPSIAFPTITEQLIEESLLMQFAPGEGQTASDDDVKNKIAGVIGIAATDPNYQARFQEEVARSGLAQDEYLSMAKAAVLRQKMLDKFTAAVPASAESVHYRQIVVSSQSDADDITNQLKNGADFAGLASSKSIDKQSGAKGGDMGWIPKGVLPKALEDTLFGLDANGVTTYPQGSNVYVLQVTEKQADRPVDTSQKPNIASAALNQWIQTKRASITIEDPITTDTTLQQWAVDHAYTA